MPKPTINSVTSSTLHKRDGGTHLTVLVEFFEGGKPACFVLKWEQYISAEKSRPRSVAGARRAQAHEADRWRLRMVRQHQEELEARVAASEAKRVR